MVYWHKRRLPGTYHHHHTNDHHNFYHYHSEYDLYDLKPDDHASSSAAVVQSWYTADHCCPTLCSRPSIPVRGMISSNAEHFGVISVRCNVGFVPRALIIFREAFDQLSKKQNKKRISKGNHPPPWSLLSSTKFASMLVHITPRGAVINRPWSWKIFFLFHNNNNNNKTQNKIFAIVFSKFIWKYFW